MHKTVSPISIRSCILHQQIWFIYTSSMSQFVEALKAAGTSGNVPTLLRANKEKCQKSASSCDECIQLDSACAWCTSPQTATRCSTLQGLRRAGCHRRFIYNPAGGMLVVRNDSRTDAEDVKTGFLQPQEVSLHLRPGVSQSFPLIVSLPADQLEVKMDLSTAGVNITIRSTTKGNPHLFQVDVEAAQCPSKSDQNETGPWSVLIAPRGVSLSVKLEITLVCQCNCTGSCEEDSPDCSGHGALVCGRCECDEPYVGHHCQINSDSLLLQDESLCRSGPDAPVCGGRGQCVAGSCECDAREDPTEAYSGQYCECSNFDCPRHNNRLCGGNGRCECGSCLCHPDWTGEACSCSADTASCLATNQMLCHGRGFCVCGTCRCSPPYSGLTCEDCPSCPSSCQSHAACVECHVFGTGAKTNTCDAECGRLTVKVVETKEELPTETEKLCKMRSHADSCFFYYTVSSLPSGGQSTVARVKEC